MTGFDFVVLAILLASMVVSMMRGLVREVLSLLAFAAAFVSAVWWGPWGYEALTPYIETGLLRMAVAYLGIFIGVLLIVGTINLALSTLIRSTGLAPADRGLGAMFGLARGLLIILILVVAAGYTPLPAEAWWRTAMFSSLSEQAVVGLKRQLPPEVGEWIPYPYQESQVGRLPGDASALPRAIPDGIPVLPKAGSQEGAI